MTAQAVWLFGSQARGDALPGSDVDLLIVTSERRMRHAGMGTVSFYLYPWRKLLGLAEGGDLFTCHISHEAKALHDPDGRLEQLRATFRFKSSYSDEIAHASNLGWFIVHHHKTLSRALIAKRVAWCVRTVLIARAAEQSTPIFAAAGLEIFSGSAAVRTLIEHKDRPDQAETCVSLLRSFLATFGNGDPFPFGSAATFEKLFRETRNYVALRTIKSNDESFYTPDGAMK